MKRAGVVILVLLLNLSVKAQQQMQPPQPPGQAEDPQFFFYEAINLVADDSTRSRIDIPYRIDHQFFIAIKNTELSLPYPFKRRGEVLIELLDKDGMSKAREINRFEIGDNGTDSKPDEKWWYQEMVSFTVPPGEYTIVFEIEDLESERKLLDRSKKVIAAKFNDAVIGTSTPLLVQASGPSDILTPLNFGGNIAFGTNASLFLQLYSKRLSTDPVYVEYSITTQNFLYQDPKVVLADTIPQLPLIRKYSPKGKVENGQLSYELTTPDNSAHTVAILIPLYAERLPLRPFMMDIKIKQGTMERTLQQPIRMVWPQMPVSLRDIDFALEVLRHITREDELDSLKSGSRDTRLKHLEEFWKEKDRTPETEYNEVMVEYYRRVDHAQRAFSSMRGGDGYKSDRGRIYILHGPATKTERTLDPSAGFQEVWIYEKQNKKFVFLDQSKSGNYTLVATQNL